jgi:hypothetical protein
MYSNSAKPASGEHTMYSDIEKYKSILEAVEQFGRI